MTRGTSVFGAVEAGGTKFVCGLVAPDNAILAERTIPTTTPGETFAAVASFFEDACATHGAPAAFGVASFGPIEIDPQASGYGRILKTPKPHWSGADLTAMFNAFRAPVAFDTDVNGAALAEQAYGAGRGAVTLGYVTVGTGVGAGVVKNGASLGGFGHYELGHIYPPRDPARDPFAGSCPFHGPCLEGLVCGPAILDRWGVDLSSLGTDEVDLIAEYLAHLVNVLVLSHMPDRIIFGGGVMKSPGLIEALRRKAKAVIGGYVDRGPLSGALDSYIVLPGLGDRAGLIGAALLAKSAFQEMRNR